jgi:hypothetical protein
MVEKQLTTVLRHIRVIYGEWFLMGSLLFLFALLRRGDLV